MIGDIIGTKKLAKLSPLFPRPLGIGYIDASQVLGFRSRMYQPVDGRVHFISPHVRSIIETSISDSLGKGSNNSNFWLFIQDCVIDWAHHAKAVPADLKEVGYEHICTSFFGLCTLNVVLCGKNDDI